MTPKNRLRVAIFFGGRSVEHEISIVTAHEAMGALDRRRYEPVPVYIGRDGRWLCGAPLARLLTSDDYRAVFARERVRSLDALLAEVTLVPVPGTSALRRIGGAHLDGPKTIPVDVFMPVLHGTFGEDGCLQGLFEMAEVAYTGCGLMAAGLGMHKQFAKQLLAENGIDSMPGLLVRKPEFLDLDPLLARITAAMPFPLFVKPCNLGSSVGITQRSVADSVAALTEALAQVFRYDEEAIIEPFLPKMRELQVAVFRGRETLVSAVEAPKVEGINTASSKYGTNMLTSGSKDSRRAGLSSAQREFNPADIPPAVLAGVAETGRKIAEILGCTGIVRVDFFYHPAAGRLYFNEINTLPGSLSYFLFERLTPPVLFTDLLAKLIDSALELRARKDNFRRTHVF